MIGKITGVLGYRAADHALIETASGVGYLVYCSERTLATLPGDAPVSLYTELSVREDLWQLFGFETLEERDWHRLLTSVQGVGAKVGLAILGTLGVEGASRAIALGDAAAIKATPGVGPKLAARIVNELKDKAPAAMMVPVASPVARAASSAQSVSSSAATAEALSALLNLGYPQGEAAAAIAQVAGDEPDADTATLIRLALRRLAPA
ncbi:MAG: Holliday junction branch migration protein RuvA [Pseudomonadota bacterium]